MKDTMLSRLLAKLNGGETAAVAAPADVAALQSEFDAFKLEAQAEQERMATALETAANAVAEADAKVAQAEARAAELQAALDAVAVEQEAALKAAQEAALNVRKQKIEAAVGTEKAPALMAATSNLDDAAFDAVVSALSLTGDVESKSKMFTETGATAEVDASKVPTESAEAKLLREKYENKAAQ